MKALFANSPWRIQHRAGASDLLGVQVAVLAGHQPFHAVKGMVTDYMHCVLLGVTKTLLKLWMDTGNCEKGFYIGKEVYLC